ncbi:unnamed protein product, partial [Larinioides sclopetarius]
RLSTEGIKSRGGGVLLALNKSFTATILDVPCLDLEAIWISVRLNYKSNLLLCVVYFPPSRHVENAKYT